MKVTIQNGAHHGLSRAEVESVLDHFPPAWSRAVASLVLYQHQHSEFECKYFEKKKILGLFWPSPKHEQPTKAQAIEQMLLALSVLAEHGSLPSRLRRAARQEHLHAIAPVRDKCLETIGTNAT